MTGTYSLGYGGSAAGARAMAQYLLSSTLDHKLSAAARYYGGEVPRTPKLADEIAQQLDRGDISYDDAVAELMLVERLAADMVPPSLHFPEGYRAWDPDAAEQRATAELLDALTRAETAVEREPPTSARLRPDIAPALAKALGIDPAAPLTESGLANLLNLRRADGGAIAGKRINQPMRSLVDVFGLHPEQPPAGQALENVLAGKRADGEAPRLANGKPMTAEQIAGPLKRFHAALGVQAGKEPGEAQLAHIRAGKSARGYDFDHTLYQRKIHATKAPIAFVDFTISADKSLSVAFALAKTEAERAAIFGIHERANDDAIAFLEKNIGFATIGAGGKDGVEPAKLAVITVDHFVSRPTIDIVQTDKAGNAYTATHEVHGASLAPDPQVHTHNIVLAGTLAQSGRIASLDLDLLDGLVHQVGGVYHARVAHYARPLGIETAAGPHGEARFMAIPETVRDLFSKRTAEAKAEAHKLAEREGLIWDKLTGPQQVGLLKAAAGLTRNAKYNAATVEEGLSDYADWARQAEAIGYRHQTVLRPDVVAQPIEPAQRQALAYEHSLPRLDEKLIGTTTMNERDLRLQAIRGFTAAGGIGDDAMADIDAVMKLYQTRGVRQGGEMTTLEWGRDVPVRGKDVTTVTTSLHAAEERELVDLMQLAAADRSRALSQHRLDAAAERFLQRNPRIDPDGPQWQAQREMMHRLGAAGAFSVAIGAAGSGKSTVISPLIDAWETAGRTVYGVALANRQATDLSAAGVHASRRSSLAAFIWRAEHGKYNLDSNSVVVVDEVSLLSTRDQLALHRLRAKHGFTLAEVGDYAQLQSVDASGGLNLARRALPDIPEVLTSIRQHLESERENVRLVRDGEVGEVLRRKQADGSLLLVAGGRDRTVERVAELWRERTVAARDTPDYTLTVSTVSNADVRELGTAIRTKRREVGELGADVVELNAIDNGKTPYKLALAVGDKVRLFDRVYERGGHWPRKEFANNGSIVDVLALDTKGMTVRNAGGAVDTIAWSKLHKRPSDPIRLTYGYAMTRNLAQGVTSTEHIDAPLDGTKSTNLHALYVGLSRHRERTWLVLDESSIRQDIANQRVDGVFQPITPADVLSRAASDMGRKPERGSALDMLDRVVGHQRGTLVDFQRAMEPVERQQHTPALNQWQELRLAVSPVARQVIEYTHEVTQRVTHQMQQAQQHAQEPTRDHGPTAGY